jgi:DNA-binding SARP family transcriptional activator
MDASLDLHLFGPVEIRWNGKPVTGFESRKALALFCYLAALRQPVTRTQLTNLFWGDKPERNGRSNLSRVLHNNEALLPGCLEIERETIQFHLTPNAFVDVACFTTLLEQNTIAATTKAIDLYHGTFMADVALTNCPEFETWLVTEQELWKLQIAQALDTLVAYYRNRGNYEQGLHFAMRLLAMDPWREETHHDVILMLALSGQRSVALAQYEKCCRVLAEELGVNPSAETTALYYRIRSGELRAKRDPNPTIVHRAQPVQQVQSSEFEQILERLANPICRMLTLIGPNNDLQKRLLAQVMTSSATAFRHGVCLVTPQSSDHPSLLLDIAHSFHLTTNDAEDDLIDDQDEKVKIWLFKQLRNKEVLLAFDAITRYRNCLTLFEELLKRAPMLKLLVSASSPLDTNGEWIFELY